MTVLHNIRELVTGAPSVGQAEALRIPSAALVWREGSIEWLGPEADLPAEYGDDDRIDAGQGIAVPGLVDCHTHLAFAGWRTAEFEKKILGASYLEIARSGGGIVSTVEKTRAASLEALTDRCVQFLESMQTLGVTTVEVKSGYGLTVDDELKILRAYREAAKRSPLTLVPTLLAAHTVPPEYKGRRQEYVELVLREILPRVVDEQLARFCDVFVEEGAFTPDEARVILCEAKRLGLGVKLHVDQLSDSGGGSLAAELGAASADHLEFLSADGIGKLRDAGVVAVALPVASLYTRQPPLDARRLVQAKVPVAVATDLNPGTAPTCHLPLAMMLGCTLNRLTPIEALNGATWIAARAIGVEDTTGALTPGRRADIAVLDAESVEHWLYHFRANACSMTFKNGARVH